MLTKTAFFVCVALQVVFGSLYRDDVLIKPSRVVSILAAACMLQLVSMKEKTIPVCTCCAALHQSHGGFLSTGWIDPAVRRDDEGKHQYKDCVRLLCLCQHLWAGLSHEKVRLKSE